MQKQSLLLLFFFLFVFGAALAQTRNAAPEFIQIDENESRADKTALFQKYYGLKKVDDLRLLRSEQDELGCTHEKFQQFYRGVPVEGATVTVHSKSGGVTMLSGNYTGIDALNVAPAITAEAAFLAAEKHVGAKRYQWEEPLSEHNDYEKPKGKLVVAVDFFDGKPARLAYKFDMYAVEPLYRAYVFIDAQTGAFIRENKRIHHANVPATGASLYNGTVSFTAETSGASYRLRQTASGNGIQTFNLNNGSNYGTATDFTSATTVFSGDATGVEAHWCSEKTYDYFFTQYGRNSYNNAGAIIKSYVHYGNDYANAFWDGSRMTYGDGGGGISPLVTLDICGHEVSHAVTEYSAGLVYANDPGALNESFSDIFGESIENYGAGTNNWLLGDQIGVIVRSFINPNSQGQPDTYLGTMWYTGGDQDLLVHTNSGVQNKWFYVLSVGENGTNDNGDAYCVQGIGMAKAAAIAYRNLTVYLNSSSNYAAARTGAIKAARDLYGIGSQEEVSTTNAWRAVGVGAGYVPAITCPANIVVGNTPGQCQATVNFTAPGGLANCPTTTQIGGMGSGSVFPVGNTTNTFRVTDAVGASSTCAFNVTVNDTQIPTIICPANATVPGNAACQASLASYTALATAGDNCAAPTKSQLPVAGTTIGLGATILTLRATDGDGLSGSCTMTVTVTDGIPPAITCPASVSVAANGSCQASLANYTGSASASDNCSTPAVSQLPAPGTTIGLGTTLLTLRATDGGGASASCTMNVSVTDQTPPSITCPAGVSVSADAGCQASLTNYAASATAGDNCTAPTKSQLPVAGTIVGLGATVLTLRATDGAGLSASCTMTVTVADNTGPTLVCKNATVNLNASGAGSITTADVFQSGTDNCGGTVNLVSVTPSTFNCSNIGANTVTLTGNDGRGNNGACVATVTVADGIAPTLLCKNATANLDASGVATITVAQINNGSFDNCGITGIGLSQITFTCANIGPNTVTLSGGDAGGNKSQCTAIVTVVDGIPPAALCKNATVQLNASGTATVAPATINNGSSDNCSFTLSLTPNTFTCANIGTNPVTLKATDAGGNTATCTATVTVQDNTAPNALCKNPTIYLNPVGQATITPADVNNGSSDNCGILSMTINDNSFNCGDISVSPVPVWLTVKDAYNHTATCHSMVTVKDNLAPTAVCQNVTVQLNAQGKATVYGATLAANSYDNCTVWSYSPVSKLYTGANIGVNNLTITVKDWSNNAATCVSQVTVQPYAGSSQNMAVNNNGSNSPVTESVELRLYPNPAGKDVTLGFQLPQDQPVRVRLFDAMGKLVLNRGVDGLEGENTWVFELGELPVGLYVVEFQAGAVRAQKRLAVQR